MVKSFSEDTKKLSFEKTKSKLNTEPGLNEWKCTVCGAIHHHFIKICSCGKKQQS